MRFLYGAYGTGNLGDDAILLGAMKVHSADPLRVIAYGDPLLEHPPKTIKADHFLRRPDLYLKAGDEFIFAGGGLFWSDKHIQMMLSVSNFAVSNGVVIKMESVGVHGFHFDKASSTALLANCTSISVRDQNSIKLLQEYEISNKAVFSRDFAFEAGLSGVRPPMEGRKIKIGINHSDPDIHRSAAKREKIVNIYCRLAEKFRDKCDFIYIPHVRHINVIDQNDVINGEIFWLHSGGLISTYAFPTSVEKLYSYYQELSLTIGSRYHMMVFSKIAGHESILLAQMDEDKYSSFARENGLNLVDLNATEGEIHKSISILIEDQIEYESLRSSAFTI